MNIDKRNLRRYRKEIVCLRKDVARLWIDGCPVSEFKTKYQILGHLVVLSNEIEKGVCEKANKRWTIKRALNKLEKLSNELGGVKSVREKILYE